ncbi:MAG: hypothetical protein LH614_22500 [Pyrinomonadaceae bacterium]|nr:hypothetical protein [Pyrinomonadaceae bacterium]
MPQTADSLRRTLDNVGKDIRTAASGVVRGDDSERTKRIRKPKTLIV